MNKEECPLDKCKHFEVSYNPHGSRITTFSKDKCRYCRRYPLLTDNFEPEEREE